MWLPSGSFWTQPAGESHITAANSDENIAYIEINSGPYLVLPAAQAFDNGERPINVDKSNIVWLKQTDSQKNTRSNVETAYLWGDTTDGKLRGQMLKIPSGFKGSITTEGPIFRAVIIQGGVTYQDTKNTNNNKDLGPGSYFGSTGKMQHSIVNS